MRIRKPVERWFDVTDDPEGARILIKHLTPGEIQDITDKVVNNEIIYRLDEKSGNRTPIMRQRSKRSDDVKETMLATVRGWENFFDEDDNPLEFNDDNLTRAIREIDGFTEFVGQCRKRLSADLADEKKDQEKTRRPHSRNHRKTGLRAMPGDICLVSRGSAVRDMRPAIGN